MIYDPNLLYGFLAGLACATLLVLVVLWSRRQPFKPGVYGVRFRRMEKFDYILLAVNDPEEVGLEDGQHLEYISPRGFLATEAWLFANVFPPERAAEQETA